MQRRRAKSQKRKAKRKAAHRDSVYRVIHLEDVEDEEGAGKDSQTPNDPPYGGCPRLKGCTPRSDHLQTSCNTEDSTAV